MRDITEERLMNVSPKSAREHGKDNMKRYNLVLPHTLFNEVQAMADAADTTVLDMLKRFIKIGLVLTKLCQSPDATLIVREGD